MFTKISLIFLVAGISSSAFGEDCAEWFKRLKVSSTDAQCELKCAEGDTDMGSFDCPSHCNQFCKPNAKKRSCQVSPYWNGRLTGAVGPFRAITGGDQELVKQALSHLPKDLSPSSLKAIVKGTKPIDVTAPFTEATSTDEFIILYPRALKKPQDLDRIITHELAHVLAEGEWKKTFENYKMETGWSSVTGNGHRDGEFVEPDGKMSADEDFANNIEFYIFDPNTLKRTSPSIFAWIQKYMGKMLHLEKGCLSEKK